MLINILDLEEISVDDIMVPRNDIAAIDLEDSWDEILAQISNSGHSRLVVYRENIDNVVGFIYLRKMLDTMRSGDFNREALEARIREAYFIPEGTSLTVQLLNFQKEKLRIGLVVDEYGDILGLLTLEDILEEIVGEFNNDPHQAPGEIQPQSDGSFLVAGTAQIRNLNRMLDLNLSADGPKTLNGIILEHLENFPSQGSVFRLYDHQFEVLALEENRVSQVRVTPVSVLEPDGKPDVQRQSQASDPETGVTQLELESGTKTDSPADDTRNERNNSTEYAADSVSARSRRASGQR